MDVEIVLAFDYFSYFMKSTDSGSPLQIIHFSCFEYILRKKWVVQYLALSNIFHGIILVFQMLVRFYLNLVKVIKNRFRTNLSYNIEQIEYFRFLFYAFILDRRPATCWMRAWGSWCWHKDIYLLALTDLNCEVDGIDECWKCPNVTRMAQSNPCFKR